MKTISKILLPAVMVGGVAYAIYKHEKRQHAKRNGIIVDDTATRYDPKEMEAIVREDEEAKKDNGLDPFARDLEKEFGKDASKHGNPANHGNLSSASATDASDDLDDGAFSHDYTDSDADHVDSEASDEASGNLDHLFVPKSLSSSEERSIKSMSQTLKSAVKTRKSEDTSHPANSKGAK